MLKNGRPQFGNPETGSFYFSMLNVILHNYVYGKRRYMFIGTHCMILWELWRMEFLLEEGGNPRTP